MTDREELEKIISDLDVEHGGIGLWPDGYGIIADAILKAGYRKAMNQTSEMEAAK